MRAAILTEPGKPLAVDDVPEPAPGAGEVLVRVAACGVCHTDLHYIDHGVPTFKPPPVILGHEISGTIESVAEESRWRPGDRVLLPAVLGCGHCTACRIGRENICAELRMFGNHMDGGFAEFVAAPAKDLVPLPDEMPLAESAIIADALTTPYHAVVNRGRVRPGDQVVVVGCGGIGLNVVQMAAAVGGTVTAVDVVAEKLDWASRLGAVHTVNAAEATDVAKKVRKLTGGGADVAFECVGLPDTQEQAFSATRNGGRLVLVGYSPKAMKLNSGRVMFREMEVMGSLGCRGVDYQRVVDLACRGDIEFESLVTGRYPLESVNEAFDALRAGEGVRSIVVP